MQSELITVIIVMAAMSLCFMSMSIYRRCFNYEHPKASGVCNNQEHNPKTHRLYGHHSGLFHSNKKDERKKSVSVVQNLELLSMRHTTENF